MQIEPLCAAWIAQIRAGEAPIAADICGVRARYIKHMMVVADLAGGDDGAIEDALEAAWELQRSAD